MVLTTTRPCLHFCLPTIYKAHINCCADDLFSFSPSLSEVNFATFVTSSSLIGNRLGTSTVLKVSACVLCCACLREIPPSPVSCVCVCALPKKSIFQFFCTQSHCGHCVHFFRESFVIPEHQTLTTSTIVVVVCA